eukprot:324457-Lingulodinium_polyedra.AAC.1
MGRIVDCACRLALVVFQYWPFALGKNNETHAIAFTPFRGGGGRGPANTELPTKDPWPRVRARLPEGRNQNANTSGTRHAPGFHALELY